MEDKNTMDLEPSNIEEPATSPEAAAKWDAMLEENDSARCVAHKKSGERCRRLAIKGATVCRVHGGASGHVRRAAQARLANAADRMAKELLGIATDEDTPAAVKLSAIKSALDRAGINEKATVEVEVGMPVFERILGGARAASRAARGTADEADPALGWVADELSDLADEDAAYMDDDVLDVEVVEGVEPEPKPTSGLQSMEDALETLRTAQPPNTGGPAPRRRPQ